jgi:hypothetical protein
MAGILNNTGIVLSLVRQWVYSEIGKLIPIYTSDLSKLEVHHYYQS